MRIKLLLLFIGISFTAFAQNLDQIGKAPWLTSSGGISANSIYYDGSGNREPFTYFINGNLNFNISDLYNIPLSFSYTNQEFGYNTPFKINRLSIHPSYKWVATHIGDVSMTFSPYTVNGHQFTGGGVDLTPPGRFKFSALYGRFLKAAEYSEEEPVLLPSYKRMGYGFKTSYDFDFVNLGLILFKAKDEANSIQENVPVDLELIPKDNAVLSLTTNWTLFDKLGLNLEYAISGITEDVGSDSNRESKGVLTFLLDENNTTQYYNAINTQLDYSIAHGTVGVQYERIDPGYRTFGAYYFNNDLENISVTASQTIFENKLSVTVNAGLQRNNLDNTKTSEMQRIVSAFNVSYTRSEKLTLTGGYSNYQSYTNIRDQFDYINEVNAFDNIDTLNYRQISQNANLGVNYAFEKEKSRQQSVQVHITYQTADNMQDGKTIDNGKSQFYNATTSYTLGYPEKALNFNIAANVSYTTVGIIRNLTLGPTLGINKAFFDKKLRANFSSAYNTAYVDGDKKNDIVNLRLGGAYSFFKNHNLNLNLLALFRNSDINKTNDFTATLGYSYTFNTFSIPSKRNKENKATDKTSQGDIAFRFRSATYKGTLDQVAKQLAMVKSGSRFQNIPKDKANELDFMFTEITAEQDPVIFKEKALNFLTELYRYEDFLKVYEDFLFEVITKVHQDMKYLDFKLEKSFVATKAKLDQLKAANNTPNDTIANLSNELDNRLHKLVGHRWMQKKLAPFTIKKMMQSPDKFLKQFKNQESSAIFELYEKYPDVKKINLYLEHQIIDFYHNKSLQEVNPDTFELKYIDKI